MRLGHHRSWSFHLLLFCTLLTVSCSGGSSSTQKAADPLVNAAQPLVTPTYEGSGQAMHPRVLYFATPWHGYSYWMSMTPYANSDPKTENPSALASNDGQSWSVPSGLTNPVAFSSGGLLADPDLLYDSASDQLWLYYIDKSFSDGTHVVRKRSSDGVTWGAEEDLFGAAANHNLSPTIVNVGKNYYMWDVLAPSGWNSQSSTVNYFTSSDGKSWSAPQTANVSQPGYVIWHIDAIWVPSKNEYWMVLASYPVGQNSGSTSLFFAQSSDGMNWTTYSRPILSASRNGWDDSEIYRSTLLYDSASDTLRIWYSAQSSKVWHTGYSECNYTALLKWLES